LILRDHLSYLLKKMKDTGYAASTESIPGIGAEARSAREMLTDLSIRVMVGQKMKALREPSKKLWVTTSRQRRVVHPLSFFSIR
jgi:hypothetical protein